MKKLSIVAAAVSLLLTPAIAAAQAGAAVAGKMVFAADGKRLGAVYRVLGDGAAQVIVNGKIKTIPADSLSTTAGKLTTSLSKKDVMSKG